MFFPISAWFAAFALTMAIEAPIVVLGFRRTERELIRLLIVIVFANLATHLAIWYVLTQLILVGTAGYLVVAEVGATVAEAALYWSAIRNLTPGRAIGVAVVANAASFAIGQLIRSG